MKQIVVTMDFSEEEEKSGMLADMLSLLEYRLFDSTGRTKIEVADGENLLNN